MPNFNQSTTALAVAAVTATAAMFSPVWTKLWDARIARRKDRQDGRTNEADRLEKRLWDYIGRVEEEAKTARAEIAELRTKLDESVNDYRRMASVASEATTRATELDGRVSRLEEENTALRESRRLLRQIVQAVFDLLSELGTAVPAQAQLDFERDGQLHGP